MHLIFDSFMIKGILKNKLTDNELIICCGSGGGSVSERFEIQATAYKPWPLREP